MSTKVWVLLEVEGTTPDLITTRVYKEKGAATAAFTKSVLDFTGPLDEAYAPAEVAEALESGLFDHPDCSIYLKETDVIDAGTS